MPFSIGKLGLSIKKKYVKYTIFFLEQAKIQKILCGHIARMKSV
jgi:hypothetical protein